MKIAIIRGAFINPFEFQLYAPLTERHEVLAVGADWRFYRNDVAFAGFKNVSPKLWGRALQCFSNSAVVVYNKLLSWTTGRSFGFYNLDNAVGAVDIVHAAETFFTMSYQSLRLAKRLGKPLIITVSENLPHMGETHPLRRARKQAVIESADSFIAITETTRKMLIAEGIPENKIQVIPWSMDLTRFKPGPKSMKLLQRFRLTTKDFVVLFVGRFIPEKGIHEILSALPELLERHINKRLRFVFVGQGPLEGTLREVEKQWKNEIRIVSPVTYEQLPDIHRLADIFILPSKPGYKIAEQFGFVLIESMACGIPVITTTVGSIKDVVGDSALTVSPGDTKALAEALSRFILSEADRRAYAQRGLERVRRENDAILNAKRLEALYEAVSK